MKYSEYLQLREVLEQEGVSVQEFIEEADDKLYEVEGESLLRMGSLNIGKILKYYLLYWGGKGIWGMIQKGIKTAVSNGIEKEIKEKLDKDAITIKNMLVDKLKITDMTKDSKKSGDEVIQKLDQNSEETVKAIIKKRYPDEKTFNAIAKAKRDKIIEDISTKVHKHRDQEIIKYMQNVLKDESDKVLKSIDQREKLTKEDKENLELYWQSKMTILKIELSTVLAEKGYLDEENMREYYDILRDQMEILYGKNNKKEKDKKEHPGVNIHL